MDQPTAEQALKEIGPLVGQWSLWRAGEPFSQRFTGRFEDDGNTILGRWEEAEDGGNYTIDFDLIYRKIG